MNKAILVQSDDWEGLFVNGKLVQEGHTLNEGISRTKYFIELSKKYNFSLDELEEGYVTDEYNDDYLYSYGCFNEDLKDVKYDIC